MTSWTCASRFAMAGSGLGALSDLPHSGSAALAYACRVHPTLASFIELEAPDGPQLLRQAVLGRRFGRRTMNLNCFDVTIDADARTVTLEDAIALDGRRAAIPLDDLLRDLPA